LGYYTGRIGDRRLWDGVGYYTGRIGDIEGYGMGWVTTQVE